MNDNIQSRTKSPLFWVGMASAIYTAVVSTGVAASITMPWWIGAIGAGLSAVLMYCNGNNPSISGKY
ncbi:MAG: hypothetical protein RRY79_00170 [Clostridia bacterium]